jgi:cyclophilin family peptidyl-prolyl cis-trans isomerase
MRKTSERPSCRPWVESLENRRLLAVSLAPISNLSVPALLGSQLALDGSGTTDPSQSFTATSSNPDIQVSVPTNPLFWTLTVSHQPSSSSDVTINNQLMTFQLFNDLTPNTVSRIQTLTNDNFYTQGLANTSPSGPGKFIPRITSASSSVGFGIIQGGSSSATSTSSTSGLTPTIATEPVQQLAFTGQYQLAMANTGSPNSSDAQFFITNGTVSASTQQSFDFNYTIFGQLVAGQQTVTNLGKVAVQNNSSGENSQPVNPVTINTVALSSQDPNGVLHINTTSAKAGETATITVTATDPTDNTTVTQSFTVTVVAYNGPTATVTSSAPAGTAQNIQLNKTTPATLATGFTISYQLVPQSPPSHGTISQFDPTTGTLVYTPNSGYAGPDSFQYQVLAQASSTSPKVAINLGTVQLEVTRATGAVRFIPGVPSTLGGVLVVDPLPRTDHGTNVINVTQPTNPVTGNPDLQVSVNGVIDSTQPAVSSVGRLVVFGAKANDQITVDPSVTVPATLDGGHGGNNVVKSGLGQTLEHGWFGHTLLVGGVGTNQLIGRKGFVRFQPSSHTNWIFAGDIRPRSTRGHTEPPKGTFYRFENGRLVPVASLP